MASVHLVSDAPKLINHNFKIFWLLKNYYFSFVYFKGRVGDREKERERYLRFIDSLPKRPQQLEGAWPDGSQETDVHLGFLDGRGSSI